MIRTKVLTAILTGVSLITAAASARDDHFACPVAAPAKVKVNFARSTEHVETDISLQQVREAAMAHRRIIEEEATARVTKAPFGMWGVFDYRPALRLRVDEKIAIAAGHDNRGLVAETWLVISANLPKWGAAGSTMMVADAVRADDLNALCHSQLTGSEFECALLALHLDRKVYGWDRNGGWRVIADPEAHEREQHRKQMNDLLFNQIPADFRRRRQ